MSKEEKIRNFNPNDVGNTNSGMYGLPFSQEECEIQIIPVPWDVTVSYKSGTAEAPYAVFDASFQVDLFDPFLKDAWKLGIFYDDVEESISFKSHTMRLKAQSYINKLSEGKAPDLKDLELINSECKKMNTWVGERCLTFLNQNKTVGLLGGDHSIPLGLMQALAEKEGEFGVLQIDAHADLRNTYQGFEFSHASIMFNALKIPQIKKLVQVGVRDYCEDEYKLITANTGRIFTYFDRDMKQEMYKGTSWSEMCDRIIHNLPEKVYLSFDIDGLDPKNCPHTGTPVAGGLETEQALFLIEKVKLSGKKIIAFDLNEIAPGPKGHDWDANVGARLLFRIANIVASSQGKNAQAI